jgi:hypothetical protein
MSQDQPRAPVKKIAAFSGMVIGTAFVGLLFGFVPYFIGASILPEGSLSGLIGAIVSVVIGYPIGVIIGLLLVGRLFHYRGSLLLGAVGSILGGALVIGLSYLSLIPGLEYTSFLVLPPLLGTTGFHLRRASRGSAE